MSPLELTGTSLTIENIFSVARNFQEVTLSPSAKKKMLASRKWIEDAVKQNKSVYGVTTGFGAFQNVRLQQNQVEELQRNLVLSHCAGVGEPFPDEVVRAMILLRANALAAGYSGVRVEVVEMLLAMLNKQVHPVVPSKGSVGSSGDLAPLSHIASVMIGEGWAAIGEYGEVVTGKEALEQMKIPPLILQAKEGLALLNGTQAMLAVGTLALGDAKNLFKLANVAASLSLEALKGKSSPFQSNVQKLRPYVGQQFVANMIREFTSGSSLLDCVDDDTNDKIQDSYSLRCIPQVHGATFDALSYVQAIIEIELNSVTDNPHIFADENEVVSAGNFHGQPLALALDFLKLAIAELGNISERRIAKLLDKNHNNGLPAFLCVDGGVQSGLMIAQYTAASLVSENKVLIHPASGDSIPTSANQEDHNSMGTIAARHAAEVVSNVEYIIAIEILCSCQAIDFRLRQNPKAQLGEGTKNFFEMIRNGLGIPFVDKDRDISFDIETLKEIVHTIEREFISVTNE
ncbi:MAG: histidine ammonia-lyase [Ignavibacteria bacterium]|nr:histidine ammonia-lyase [Ignavibacteria bacterium]